MLATYCQRTWSAFSRSRAAAGICSQRRRNPPPHNSKESEARSPIVQFQWSFTRRRSDEGAVISGWNRRLAEVSLLDRQPPFRLSGRNPAFMPRPRYIIQEGTLNEDRVEF